MLRLVLLSKPPLLYAAPVPKVHVKQEGLVQRLTAWGERLWHQWGEAPIGSYKLFIHQQSIKLINRLPWEERSLWRIHRAFQQNRKSFPIVLQTDTDGWREVLSQRLEQAIWRQRVARFIYAGCLIPLTLLVVLPLVKAVWAWCLFRLIARHRALHGALWLRSSMAQIKRDHTPPPATKPDLLDQHFTQ